MLGRAVLAASLSALTSVGLTALAIRAGHRFGLLDHPLGWKEHARPTPYVGGVAVLVAFAAVGPAMAGDLDRLWPLPALAAAMAALGFMDDRSSLPASLRVAAELGAGALLWVADLGFSVFSSDATNLVLTACWVVALINAINLLDLMDGVASSVAAVAAAGVGVLAALGGDDALALLAFALAGSCAGFLVWNLRSPARVYLGDSGTMAIGFLVAGCVAAMPYGDRAGWAILLGAVPLFGVPLFDVALRIHLRLRRGISLLTGGPDSAANWLRTHVGTPRRVSIVLSIVQAALSGLAIGALRLSDGAVLALSALLGAAALAVGRTIAGSPWAREGDARAHAVTTAAIEAARP